MKNKKGFTLVEILGVIVIIAILSGVVIVAVNRYIVNGKDRFNKSIESTLVSMAKEYYSENLAELPNGKIEANVARYTDVLWASDLQSKGYISNEIVDANDNLCRTSYVVVKNNGSNEYTYTPCVVCDNGYVSDGEGCDFIQSTDKTPPTCSVEAVGTTTANGVIWTDYTINGDKIQLSLTGIDNENVAGFEVNGVYVSANDAGTATRYVEQNLPEGLKVTVYDKNNNIGYCTLPSDVKIDITTPTVALVARKKDARTSVRSGQWSNEGLNFTFNTIRVGDSGATIYYCKDTTNTCTPNTIARSGITITSYNTITGIYYIRYKVVSGANKTSGTLSYTAKVDTTNPVCKLSVTESGITFESKTDSNGIEEYGMGTTTTAVYNSVEQLNVGLGTFYGYVKDEAGNTNTCSATITNTIETSNTKTTKTCGYSNLKCWNYSSYECPYGYSYCSWCEISDCQKVTGSYGCDCGYDTWVKQTHFPSTSTAACDENDGVSGNYKLSCWFSGTTCYCDYYSYSCNDTCYNYAYTDYDRWCDYSAVTGEYLSGDYCYLDNQGTECPSGWKVSDYTTYGFTESTEEVETCEPTSSFTCNSSNHGKSYVSSCAPAYGCTTGTKLNDNFCYVLK